jgi:autotransporter-associated beta strand protein
MKKIPLLILLPIGVLSVGAFAHATELWFAGDGITAGTSGTWDTTGTNWGLAVSGPFDLVWTNDNVDSATFENLAGNVTVAADVVVNQMRAINDGTARTFPSAAGSITFAGEDAGVYVPGANTTSGANTLTMNLRLDGDALEKTGGGRLRINNSASTLGKWVVTEGIISANSGGNFGAAPAELVPDYFTFDNGAGIGFNGVTGVSISSTRGIYLRGNGKLGVASTTSTLTISSPITGPGGLTFPGFGSFPGQLSGAAGTFIFNNPNSDYQGGTTVSVGILQCGANEVIPNTTTLTVSGSARCNVNGFTETVGNVIVNGSNARLQDTVGGGSLVATNYDMRNGGIQTAVLAGDATLTKTTGNSIQLNAANTYTGDTILKHGTIVLNAVGRFGDGTGTLYLDGSEGSIFLSLAESRTEATTLLNPVVLTASEATIQSHIDATEPVIFRHGGPWTTSGGTLYLWNASSFSFEAVLSGEFDFTTPIDVGSGCQLTSANPDGTDQTYSGGISGSGSFRRSASAAGGRTIFTTDNSYSGGTVVEAGTLLVNNPGFGSGTGSGEVTVSGPSGVLGGTGVIGGNVAVNSGGSVSAGASVGILTLQNGLNLSGGGTNIWELAALKDNSDGIPGTDFDQIVLTGGELQLGGSSQLVLAFAGGTAPNSGNPFWQASRSWTIINLSGGANSANASFAVIANASYNAGNFSTSVGGGGSIILTFTPGVPSGPTITSHPQSRTNHAGTSATFTVAATGSDPLGYQWYFQNFGNPVGGNSASYTKVNVQAGDAGNYFVVVTNGLGSATSGLAALTVVPPPSLAPLIGAGTPEVNISWPAIPGQAYQVWYNTNLATANWYLLTNVVAAGPSVSVTANPPVGDPQRYFRVLVP